ncbi:MAG: NAD(P)/FAD-dependent oxidoreductase [Candidatus Saganbacteria bacterium]|nr:NAD(P)/FAD-dependent oxidoreductase [Candidatus Saganbacteria bacterium]
MYDVLIVGGGVTGTAIARELSRYRLKLALLEKEVELAFGVSKSNSGIIHPGTQNPPGSLKGKLCVEGNRLTKKLAKELGVDYKEVGELIVIFSEDDRPRLLKIKADAEKLGVTGLRIVGRDWLLEHEPNINPEVLAALFAPTAGIISPYRWVYDQAENAAGNGVEILTSHKVIGIGKEAGRFDVSVAGGKVFSARFVVNCAGLCADEIAGMAGITGITIKPRKGEEFILDKKREYISNHLLFPLPAPTSKGVLVIKTSDGNPMIGPTAEEVADKEDLSTSDDGLKQVLESVKKLIPAVNENDIIAYFAGLRPVAGDDFIIRHEDKVPGLINVAGIQSPGLTAAPAIALLVAGLLKKNGLGLRKKFFFHRFRAKTVHLFSLLVTRISPLIRKDPAYGDIVCRCELVSAKEVREAVRRGARTLDGIKFRTRAQAGRCHGGFCTTRIMKIMAEELNLPMTAITKRGKGSELIKEERT